MRRIFEPTKRACAFVFLIGTMSWVLAADTTLVERHNPTGELVERYGTLLDSLGHPQKEGLAEEWYSDGTLKSRIRWKKGQKDGDAIYNHSNGRKSHATHYQEGKKLGFSTAWFENGQKQWEAMFRADQANGVWREWYSDGKKKMEALYDRGRLNGHVTWWYPNGRIQQERDYHDGVTVPGTVRAYDSTGQLSFPNANKTAQTEKKGEGIAKKEPNSSF
jgi:hypothetical protein